MGLVDASELHVVLSGKEACWGLKEWPIRSARGVVGFAKRRRGVAALFSGLRHRMPIEVIDGEATVLCVVRRSRAPKSFCKSHFVRDAEGELLGVIRRSSARDDEGHREYVTTIEDGQERVVARRSSLRDTDGPEWESEDSDWSSVTTSIEPQQSWITPSTWKVSGMESLPEDRRLLLVATQLVREPWSSGESQSSNKTYGSGQP